MITGFLGTILRSEMAYAARKPNQGYTCSLAELFGQQVSDVPGEESQGDFNSGLVGKEYAGYKVSLTGCEGSPASKFQIIATPIQVDSEMKIFCTDGSGTIRFMASGRPAACLTQGQVYEGAGSRGASTID